MWRSSRSELLICRLSVARNSFANSYSYLILYIKSSLSSADLLRCTELLPPGEEHAVVSHPRIKWAENYSIDAGYEHKGRLMAATKLMWVSVLMFVDRAILKNANTRADIKVMCRKKRSRDGKQVLCLCESLLCTSLSRKSCPAIYCPAAECNAGLKGSKSLGRLLGFCENCGNAGEMDEQHFITINQGPLINKVHFLFSMIQGIIKRTLSLSFWLTNPSSLWKGTRWRETLSFAHKINIEWEY